MKLRNKKTGEILPLGSFIIQNPNRINCEGLINYDSLAELNEDWEDYEEPKGYWCIDWTGGVNHITVLDAVDKYEEDKKAIGNYFETEEQAEKAVEKLKAWKRLKDEGFMVIDKKIRGDYVDMTFILNYLVTKDVKKDIDLLFGGEE